MAFFKEEIDASSVTPVELPVIKAHSAVTQVINDTEQVIGFEVTTRENEILQNVNGEFTFLKEGFYTYAIELNVDVVLGSADIVQLFAEVSLDDGVSWNAVPSSGKIIRYNGTNENHFAVSFSAKMDEGEIIRFKAISSQLGGAEFLYISGLPSKPSVFVPSAQINIIKVN